MDNNNNIIDTHVKLKKRGNAGIKGINFQIHLITMVLLKTMEKFSQWWQLSSENDRAGNFDDVVLECPNGAILMQAKHKETRNVTWTDLLSISSNNKFSLSKYFFSYLKARKNYQIQNVVIITNTDVNVGGNEVFLKKHSVHGDNILHCHGKDCFYYTFTDEILPELKKKIEEYIVNNKEKDQCVFDAKNYTEEDIKKFLEHLQLYYKYPSDTDLYKVIEQQLSKSRTTSSIYSRVFPKDIINKLTGWYEQLKSSYLNKEYTKKIFCEIRSEKYCETLDHYNIQFKTALSFDINHKIYHVVTRKRYFLQALKVFRALHDVKLNTLYVNPNDDVEVQKQTIEAFDLPSYKFLVIIGPKITEGAVVQQLCTTLNRIIAERTYKKVILVAEENNELFRELEINNDVCKIDQSITFNDLSDETQKRLLQKRNINLGNKRVSLEEIFGINNCKKLIDDTNLEILVKGKGIVRIEPLRDRGRCYISITHSNETFSVYILDLHMQCIEESRENSVQVNISTTKPLNLVGDGGELVSVKPDGSIVDVNIGNDAGNTPLHFAAENNDVRAVRMLLDHGACIDYENKAGNTALHVASRHGNSDTVKLLLRYGASVNIGNRSGNTPLHLAVRERMLETAQLLLERTR